MNTLAVLLLAAAATAQPGPRPPYPGPGPYGPPPPFGGPGGPRPYGPPHGGPGGPPPPFGGPGGPPHGGPGGPPPPFGGPGGPPPPFPCPAPAAGPEEANKAIIKDFYEIAFDQKNVGGAADKYMDDNIIEHNPNGGDGKAEFKVDMGALTAGSPGQVMEIKRIAADGDLVFVHGKTSWFGQDVAFVDIYRLKNGKIVEHWDVIQNIEKTTRNPHPYF